MKFNLVPRPHVFVDCLALRQQFSGAQLRNWRGLLLLVLGFRHGYRYVRLLKSRDLVILGRLRIGFVSGAIRQVKMQGLRTFADENALTGECNSGRRGRACVGNEYSLPNGRALCAFHVLNVEHKFGEAFIKDPGLNFKRDLRVLEPVLQPPKAGL